MKLKLKTGFCEVREFDLTIDRQALRMACPEKKLRIPLQELKRFSLDESRPGPPRFQLETDSALYQGRFLHPEDSSWLIRQLQLSGSHSIEIVFHS